MTQKTLERNLRMTALADAYSDHIQSIDQYSDADLTAAYEENHDLYSTVRYECIAVLSSSYMSDEESGSESTTTDSASGSENSDADVKAAAALAAAQEAAAEASSRVKNGESAEAVADEIGATYSDSSTYYSSTGELSVWLFDDARREGDVTVLDYYGVGAQVVVFHGKQRADFFPVNVRHILVEDEDKANELLAQFNAGDKTEASFAALATENTTDTGSASNGGLYEDIYIGQMVKPFEDWCFDSSRKAGDVGIVKTDYGYHVMYFCSTGTTPYWKTLAAVKLANDKLSSITGAAETETLNGVKYVDQ
jgi:parvulin-like peptidyl-prolyl isomerase